MADPIETVELSTLGSVIRVAYEDEDFRPHDYVYAYKSDGVNSMAHHTGTIVGQAFRAHYFDSNRQRGSSGLWELYSTTPVGDIGTVAFLAGTGLTLTGAAGMYRMVAGAGDLVDIRACGILCDGVTVGQQSKLGRVISAAKDRGWKLTGAGTFKSTETIDMRTCQCDFSMLKFQFGLQSDTDLVSDYFCPDWQNPPAGVIVQTYVAWDGTTKGFGVGIRGGGNNRNSEKMEQIFFVWGDGNSVYSRVSTVIGVRWEDDDSGLGTFRAYTAYTGIGHGILGPAEKHIIWAHTTYSEYAVFLLPGASGPSTADTLEVRIYGQNCKHIYTESLGADTSVRVVSNFEARDDPLDGSPAFYIRNGKNSSLTGRLRGQNGIECILIDRNTNSGTDTFWIDFEIINSYGTNLHIHRLRQISGQLKIKESRNGGNGNTGAVTPCPSVWLERVVQAGAFSISFSDMENTEGAIRIGDSTLYYPIEATFGPLSVMTGNTTNFGGSDNTPSNSHPTNTIALEIQKMVRGTVNMPTCGGKIIIGPDCKEVHLNVPMEAKRYTLTRDPASSCVISYEGIVLPMDYPTGHTFTKYESGQISTNLGATAMADYHLPAAEAGLEFEFLCLDADGMRVIAAAGDTILLDAEDPIDSILSTTLYSSVKLRAADADHWICVGGNNRAAFSIASNPPTNDTAPSFTPSPPTDGEVVTYIPGTWTGEDSVTFDWYIDGVAVGDTEITTFDTSGHGGSNLFVRETAINATGSATEDSATAVIGTPQVTTTKFTLNLSTQPFGSNIGPVSLYDSTADTTWIVWQQVIAAGTPTHIVARTYDHTNENFSPEVTVATNGLVNDDTHGQPSIFMDADGYVVVAYGAHNTPQQFASTTYPRDPTTWRALANGADGSSYPHWTRIGTHYFLGNRYTAAGPTSRYFRITPYTTAAGVLTAGSVVTVVSFGTDTRFYQGTHVVVGNDIHLVATRANQADTFRKDIYYFVVQTDGAGTITGVRNFDNTVTVLAAAFPVDLTTANASFRLYTSSGGNIYTGGPALGIDTNNHPHVLFTSGTTVGGPCDFLHIWHNGTSWQSPDTVDTAAAGPYICEAVPGASGKVALWIDGSTGRGYKTWDGGSIGAVTLTGTGAKGVLAATPDLRTVNSASGIGYAYGDPGPFTFSTVYTPVNTECATYFARLNTLPDITKQYYIDRLFTVVKAIGIAKFDAIWLHCMDDAADALLDLFGNVDGVNHGATFTADRGLTTDGIATYVDLVYDCTTGTAFLQNSAHLSGAFLNATAGGAAAGSTSGNGPWINPRVTASDDISTRMNQVATSTVATTISTPGFILANRSASNAVQLYRNGSAQTLSNNSQVSAAPAGTLALGHAGGIWTAQRFALTTIGGSLTSGEQSTLYLKGIYPLLHSIGAL